MLQQLLMIRLLILNFVFLFLSLGWFGLANAASWNIEGFFIPSQELNELQEKYPQLTGADHLSLLLEHLARRYSFSSLQAIWRDQSWVLVGKFAVQIRDIDIVTRTIYLRDNLEDIAEKFISRVDSADNQNRLQREVKYFLDSKGFPRAIITLTIDQQNNEVVYRLEVDKNRPCLITEIDIPFELPKKFLLATKIGDLCDVKKIKENIEVLRQQLRDAGYQQARLRFERLVEGRVVLSGELGKKITTVFIDEDGDQLADELSDSLPGDSFIVGQEIVTAGLLRRLRDAGYVQATVSDPQIKTDGEAITYTYVVVRGEKFTLQSLNFRGLSFINEKRAREIADIDDIDRQEIDAGLARLAAFYAENGFWQAKITEPIPIYNPVARTVALTVTVSEGQQRLFSGLQVEGNIFFSDNEIREMLGATVDQPLAQQQLATFEQKLKNEYLRHGYIYLKITIAVATKGPETRVVVAINESVRARFGLLRIVGLRRTARQVVEREMNFGYGDWYDQEKLAKTRQALTDLGIFSLVQVHPTRSVFGSNRLEYVDITVEVREAQPGQVSFGPGYSFTRGLRYSIEGTYNNIGGTGRKIRLRAGLSEERHQKLVEDTSLLGKNFSIVFFEPYVLKMPLLGVVGYSYHDEADDYQKFKRTAEASLLHKLFAGTKVSLFYAQKANRTAGTVEQASNLITSQNVRIGETGVRLSLDSRDKISWPSRGTTLDLALSWARFYLFSDLAYFRINMMNNYFFSVYPNVVFAMSLSYNSYMGVENSNRDIDILPASERLQIGGSDSVRGFANTHNLGPYVRYYDGNNNSYLQEMTGGTQRILLKFELRYQFLKDLLATSLFVDAGNVFFTNDEQDDYQEFLDHQQTTDHRAVLYDNFSYRLQDLLTRPDYLFTKNYSSYGLALNYLSPIGLVNVAYGIPLSQPQSKDCNKSLYHCSNRGAEHREWYRQGQFHFNVGAKF